MTKTKEELKQLKEEYELLTNKLKELTEDELKQVVGGNEMDIRIVGVNHDIPGLEAIGPTSFSNSVNVNEVLTNVNPSNK